MSNTKTNDKTLRKQVVLEDVAIAYSVTKEPQAFNQGSAPKYRISVALAPNSKQLKALSHAILDVNKAVRKPAKDNKSLIASLFKDPWASIEEHYKAGTKIVGFSTKIPPKIYTKTGANTLKKVDHKSGYIPQHTKAMITVNLTYQPGTVNGVSTYFNQIILNKATDFISGYTEEDSLGSLGFKLEGSESDTKDDSAEVVTLDKASEEDELKTYFN